MSLRNQLKVFLPAWALAFGMSHQAVSQHGVLGSAQELKQLTLEQLMNIEVTSVSRRPENLNEVASAIQVISREDIHRSGATNVPEALRLVPNLQVAQLSSSAWIISARGFNAAFSNKLLVMIDGRTVYSPLFAGVFWDVQNVLLEDIDRIEVVSGPGGAQWGANAVNGVINIITKNARETQGLYASVGSGNYLRRNAALRYGGKAGSEVAYRIYGTGFFRDNTFTANGSEHSDAWNMFQTGLSADWNPSESDAVIIHGNIYTGTHDNVPSESDMDGQNVLARWSHQFSEESNLVMQAYFDRTWRRDIPSTISDETETYDFEFDHRFDLNDHHEIVWGGGYRFIDSKTQHSTEYVGLLPPRRRMQLFSLFIQDEISLVNDQVRLILGTKLQHNVFSAFEVQPTARVAWTKSKYTLWGAISRAVRAPSRIDVDYHLPTSPQPPEMPSVAGGPDFTSEKLMAYEAGYRLRPTDHISFSLAAFINRYDDLYSVEALPNTLTFQIQNGSEGTSRGVEFTGMAQIGKHWRLRGGYTYLHKDLETRSGTAYNVADLGNDAENRFLIHSMVDLPANFHIDISFRHVDPLPSPYIPDYLTFDARLAWTYKNWEVAAKGQNLLEDRHREFLYYIPRTIYGNISCRF